MATPFSVLMERAQVDADGLAIDVPEDWMQGRTVFGGLQLALALRAMRALVPDAAVRSLQAAFVAPVAGRVVVRPKLLRAGKSATQVEARIVDGEATAALVFGVFGAPRDSRVRLAPAPPRADAQAAVAMPFRPGLAPNFMQHFDMRLLAGNLPLSGAGGSEFLFEIGLRDEARAGESHVVAIADCLPPLALAHSSRPAPVSTLTWMLEFLADDLAALASGPWRLDGRLLAASDGYTNQSTVVWAPGGVPVALSHQSVAVFG